LEGERSFLKTSLTGEPGLDEEAIIEMTIQLTERMGDEDDVEEAGGGEVHELTFQ